MKKLPNVVSKTLGLTVMCLGYLMSGMCFATCSSSSKCHSAFSTSKCPSYVCDSNHIEHACATSTVDTNDATGVTIYSCSIAAQVPNGHGGCGC